nr:carotenoid 9,10(9',10')-cleavage dioxygenase 1 [Quercus suber]
MYDVLCSVELHRVASLRAEWCSVAVVSAMSVYAGQKRKRSRVENIPFTPQARHPYLSGNFAPIQQTLPLTKCKFTGSIPHELGDGQYVRNGSNPVANGDLGRDAHWFDGDGMLAGVLFRRNSETGTIEPEFVNQYILTDLYLSTLASPALKVPILPSIAVLVNPIASIFYVMLRIVRTLLLVLLSHLPGSRQKIKRISVANTNVVYHDGRALATCESGPPMRIQLPGLETVGWYDGANAEGETLRGAVDIKQEKVLGQDGGLISFMREWTTAHPKVDPKTKEMLMFHSSFAPPYVQYSIIPQTPRESLKQTTNTTQRKLLNAAVPGITSAKMMHDFGVSLQHTVIMDLPLSLDPMNQLKGKPPVTYDSSKPSRFGVFPRHTPSEVTWFETDASCIFHTANSWDEDGEDGKTKNVNMLACRLTSASLVFAAGNIAPPVEKVRRPPVGRSWKKQRMPFFSKYSAQDDVVDGSMLDLECPIEEKESLLHITEPSAIVDCSEAELLEDQCQLYYYSFSLATKQIQHQWALSTIPFEFPSVHPDLEMQNARYIYGCSTTSTTFGAALGKATKIDALVKVDATTLIARGHARSPRSVTGAVDERSMAQVLASQHDPTDPIKVFQMPPGWYAQEPRFVPATPSPSPALSREDDGYLVFYAFDEAQLDPATGDVPDDTQFQMPPGWYAQEPRFVPATPSPSPALSREDDGYLVFYAFDEAQLDPATGDVPDDTHATLRARSELWIVDARDMSTLLARIHLPQRVPYGLHGTWWTMSVNKGHRVFSRTKQEKAGATNVAGALLCYKRRDVAVDDASMELQRDRLDAGPGRQ